MKPGYKQTDVGVIPEEWEVSTVGREFEIKLGKMLDAEKNFGVPKPYLGNKAVQWDRIDISDLPTVPMSRADIERFRLRKGDLLVCEGGEVGRAAIWEAPLTECYFQKALHRLRPLRGFNSQVMAALLRQWSDRGLLTNYVTQTSIAHLPREKFMEVPMPVPPLPEQRAIAEALSDVDALLGALDRLIAKKRDLKQAAMQQLLTGQTRLPGFHGEWEVKRLGDVAMLKNGYAFKSDTYTSLGTYKVITIANVQDGYMTADACNTIASEPVDLQPHQRLRLGDILISMTGNVGRVCCVVEDHCLLNQRVGKLVPVGVVEGLLFVLLGQPSFISAMTGAAKGGAQPNLSASDITEHPLSIPKDAAEQTAIAGVLGEMDAELAGLEQRRKKTRALKQAMMQELLTGRTRLI